MPNHHRIQRRGDDPYDWSLYDGHGEVGVEHYFRESSALSTSVMWYHLEPGVSEGPHLHRAGDPDSCSDDDAEEMYVVVSGEVMMSIGDDDVTLAQGDAAYVPTGIRHGLRNESAAAADVMLLFGPPVRERSSQSVSLEPAQLVEFDSSLITRSPGPDLSLRWGMPMVADPWWPESLQDFYTCAIGMGDHPTGLSTVRVRRDGHAEPVPISRAAWIGRVEDVTQWQPLVVDEEHYHFESDSALGAFFSGDDSDVLRPLFEDGEHMQGVYDRVLEERIVPMEVDGRIAAVVFLCPDGSGRYPAYVGFDASMSAVAMLVDLRFSTA